MASLNRPTAPIRTHEGATAKHISKFTELKRTVLACLLWEDGFYESGVTIADRIATLVPQCDPVRVSALAQVARDKYNLRHVPLHLVREMARHKTHQHVVAQTLDYIIKRPDEITEFLAIYWKGGKCPVAACVKKGLAQAFRKFDEYSLAKYNRDGAIKLRDAIRICHPTPLHAEQAALWKKLLTDQLATPDTWEVALSSGADKKATWLRLIAENKLGALALLRNLRNMQQVGVDDSIIKAALVSANTQRVLPYRFIAAATHAPQLEPALEDAMLKNLEGHGRLPGKTVLMIDVSGSMSAVLSSKSDLRRIDAAAALAMLLRQIGEEVVIKLFNNELHDAPPRRGFALRDLILAKLGGGTRLGAAVTAVNVIPHDRLIVISDEQSQDRVPDPICLKSYMLNVASNQNGVGYGKWTNITGFSEAVIDYIIQSERAE